MVWTLDHDRCRCRDADNSVDLQTFVLSILGTFTGPEAGGTVASRGSISEDCSLPFAYLWEACVHAGMLAVHAATFFDQTCRRIGLMP